MSMKWYVVQSQSNYEQKVQKGLLERIKRDGLEAKFGQVIVPAEEVIEMRAGQKRKTLRKFFPGYVLVQVETEGASAIDNDCWHLIKHTPNVLGFIGGTPDKPRPITDKEADRILDRIKATESKPVPKIMYQVGETVRIVEGPFKDFDAIIEEPLYDKNKAKVGVLIFGRQTSMEIDFSALEKPQNG